MDSVRSYMISVTAAAIICSILLAFIGKKGTSSTIIRLLAGIFMTYTIISPVVDIKFDNLEYITKDILHEADLAISAGKNMASLETNQFIKTNLEAYILDKASSLRVNLDIEVRLNDTTNAVESVALTGKISPYAKEALQKYITDELGISKEVLIWQE